MDEEKRKVMLEALRNFIRAGYALSDVWYEDAVKQYPPYLPSFDEFVLRFSFLMEEPE